MTAVTRNPTNKDLLQSTKFRLNFSRLDGMTYFCQTSSLPGVSLSEVVRNTPFIDLFVPGEKLMYDPLTITFLVDEDLRAWEQIHDWIRGMTFPVNFEEYMNLDRQARSSNIRSVGKAQPQYSDGSMTIFTNKNNPNLRIEFKDLFPISLGAIQFSTMDSSENIITADASFRFSYYNIVRT